MLFGDLTQATFLDRPNRFLGLTDVWGKQDECFIPNSGQMRELLFKGAKVYLKSVNQTNRRTHFDLVLVEVGGIFVSIDSRVPNTVIAEAVEMGLIPEFREFRLEKREPKFKDSRFDMLLSCRNSKAWVEVKSCTLVTEGIALFPDAPTKRGTRHVRQLELAKRGGRSAIIFLIQRDDAYRLEPNWTTDPEFASALKEASLKGVETYAYTSKVTKDEISINRRVPVKI